MMLSGQYTTISRLKQQSCFRLLNRPGETSLGQPPSEANMRLLLRHERGRGLRSRMRSHAAATAAPASHNELPATARPKPEVVHHRGVVIGKVDFVVVGDAHGVRDVAVPVANNELPASAGAEVEVLRYGGVVVSQVDLIAVDHADCRSSVAIPIAKDQLPATARTDVEVLRHGRVVVGRVDLVAVADAHPVRPVAGPLV